MQNDPNQGDRNQRRATRRDPYSRWSRLPPVFRSGEYRIPAAGEEPQRIILHVKTATLDRAQILAEKAGAASLSDYCAGLLSRAIDDESYRSQVAESEARRGKLEGLNAIADDPDYLAEWREKSESAEFSPATHPTDDDSLDSGAALTVPIHDVRFLDPDDAIDGEADGQGSPDAPPVVRIERSRPQGEPRISERIRPDVLSESARDVVIRGLGTDEPSSEDFLPALRAGRQVRPEKGEELLRALDQVEAELRGVNLLERRLSYSLHRLALESQVLLTELWPGVFDDSTIELIRAVQERVERILSGLEISYAPDDGPGAEGGT
ncbi:hypothetical protein [Aquisphaera insulae]|uniref:hypothetical protein n=1 Tax=Aquisphaera insulae TaxID=2712864 RepID=UPI0013ED6756|nr:hypothetical protein [Aquisphaera insulae]